MAVSLRDSKRKDLLLVDELGDLQDAIMLAAETSGIQGIPPVVEPSKQFSFSDMIATQIFGFRASSSGSYGQ